MLVFVGALAGPDGPWVRHVASSRHTENASVYTGWPKKLSPGLIAAYPLKNQLYSKDRQTGHLSSGARRESKCTISVRVVYAGWAKKCPLGTNHKIQLYMKKAAIRYRVTS